eukprot:Skav207930  [mRNA]  locus=scaffold1441:293494:298136:+ [translate_table: standard]
MVNPWLPPVLKEEDLPTEPWDTINGRRIEPGCGSGRGTGGCRLRAFRQLARSRPLQGDRILEVGCCFGQCTVLLARAAAEECVELTAERLKEAELTGVARSLRFDMLAHPELLRILASCSPPFTVVFADIGGNRELTHVVELLQLLSTTMHDLQYIAVKSDALASELGAAPAKLQEQIDWWEDGFAALNVQTGRTESSKNVQVESSAEAALKAQLAKAQNQLQAANDRNSSLAAELATAQD